MIYVKYASLSQLQEWQNQTLAKIYQFPVYVLPKCQKVKESSWIPNLAASITVVPLTVSTGW